MKTKLTSLLALVCVLNINAAEQAFTTSGSASVSYKSDHYFRGAKVADDSLNLGTYASLDLGAFKLCAQLNTNQPDTGNDFTVASVGVGKTFADDLLKIYAGVQNRDQDNVGSELDVFIGLNADLGLDTTVVVYKDIDEDLYTVEGSLGHKFELGIVDLEATIDGGITEEVGNNRSYVGGSLVASKSFGALTVEAGGSLIDSDEAELDETLFAGISLSF
jgi:hypothetical protein